jgi:hypothetical protein
MPTVSKRWYDNGSNRVSMIECSTISTGASVTPNAYIVSVTLQREQQNEKRADLHETERMNISFTLPEAREFAKRFQERIAYLEYYSRNAKWPSER